jgi:inner membrane protein
MLDYVVSFGIWNWFIAAGLLLALELMLPGAFMLWLGLSALLVGLVSLGVVWPWQAQVVTFAVLSLAMIPLWRRFGRNAEKLVDQPFLNRRNEGYVGQIFTLEKPIVSGTGTVRINDTLWRVAGPDTPAGSRVKAVRAEGGTLFVEPA